MLILFVIKVSIKICHSTDKGLYLLVEYTPFRLRRNIAARLAPFIARYSCSVTYAKYAPFAINLKKPLSLPLYDSTDKRFYSLAEYTPFRLVGIERTRHFALRFRYLGSVDILSRWANRDWVGASQIKGKGAPPCLITNFVRPWRRVWFFLFQDRLR